MPTASDRRAHVRTPAEIACKLLRRAESRYRAAQSADISAGGVLLELRTPKPLQVGEVVAVSMSWTGSPLMRKDDLVSASVVRAGPLLDQLQHVALAFDEPQAQAESLRLADADAA